MEYGDGKIFITESAEELLKAFKGKGLGHRFLRHIEKTLFCFFLSQQTIMIIKKEFEILVNELEHYNPELLHKQFIIAISKSDMLDEELKEAIIKELPKKYLIFSFPL